MFGNEDKEGWLSFWKFAKRQMPCLNTAEMTIITDRVLDIDRRLMILFSFTVKLVSEIMRASWGSLCAFPKVHPINVIASGGMFLTAFHV